MHDSRTAHQRSSCVTVAERLEALRAQIDAELEASSRTAGSVTLVGIAKRQPIRAIEDAVAAGLADVGENYVQEMRRIAHALPSRVRRHFVGHVQRNKAKAIVELFDVVQSVDGIDVGMALAKAAAAAGRVLPVLIQLNISPSERFGCPPEQADRLAEQLRAQPSLRVEGAMAIGPLGVDRDATLKAFELAAKTFGRIGGSTLSMGMSGDWREAVRAGSTMVRIGTALFGRRGPKDV